MNQEVIQRAQAAASVIELPAFQMFVEYVRQDVFQQWTRTNVAEVEKREQLHSVMTGLQLLLQKAQTYIEAQKFEERSEASIPDA